MTPTPRPTTFWHRTNIVLAAIGWGILFAVIEGFGRLYLKDGTSTGFQVLGIIDVLNAIFFLFLLVTGVISLIRRKWASALCIIVALCVLYTSTIISLIIKRDRFAFTSSSHSVIAQIYKENGSEFSDGKQQFVDLYLRCDPPDGCYCWLLWDPNHTSRVELDVGRWHRPLTPMFAQDSGFAIVDVKRIDSDAYSVLGCTMDWRGWFPLPPLPL